MYEWMWVDDESLKGCYYDDDVGCSDPLSENDDWYGMWLLTWRRNKEIFLKFVIAFLVSFVSNFPSIL